ncbi:efflux RND transporter periplasmic adaptor subunit [Egbenema bharatensis]|uniref:efflux RND transporter periplasmic adaptor subunit n=1 Tax=Egbenema bharatensis TaxID=3463334 RepID=UPI003A857877
MANRSPSLTHRVIGVAFLASVLTSACSNPPAQGQGPPPAMVELEQVESTNVRESSEFVGALEAQDRVELRPEIQGRIVAIRVSPGQSVASGEPLIELRAERSQAQVSGAVADVEAAQATISTVEAELETARAELQSAIADEEFAQSDFERRRELIEEGALPEQDLDALNRALSAATANRNAAERRVEAANDRVNQARAQLSRAQADQQAAATDLDDSLVRAPIAGVVGNVPVRVGDFVTPDRALTSIVQNDTLDLNISVPIERSPQLRVGLPVELLDSEGSPLLQGQISFVSPEVNTVEQAVLAKASFPNQGQLRDGQFVRARVIWETGPGILVPVAAVTRIAGQTFVYVAQPNEEAPPDQPQQIARQRPVQVGAIEGNRYQILSGLEPGEQVVTAGILNLSDGAPIMDGPPPGQPEQPMSAQ